MRSENSSKSVIKQKPVDIAVKKQDAPKPQRTPIKKSEVKRKKEIVETESSDSVIEDDEASAKKRDVKAT